MLNICMFCSICASNKVHIGNAFSGEKTHSLTCELKRSEPLSFQWLECSMNTECKDYLILNLTLQIKVLISSRKKKRAVFHSLVMQCRMKIFDLMNTKRFHSSESSK